MPPRGFTPRAGRALQEEGLTPAAIMLPKLFALLASRVLAAIEPTAPVRRELAKIAATVTIDEGEPRLSLQLARLGPALQCFMTQGLLYACHQQRRISLQLTTPAAVTYHPAGNQDDQQQQ